MKLRALLWSAFIYAVVWLSILGAHDLDATAAVAFPDRFRPAELVVEGSTCGRSGDEVLWACEAPGFLSGEESGVEGRRAVHRWTSEDGLYLPDGERIPVLAAAVPVPFLPAAVIPPVESPRAWGAARLGRRLKLPFVGLGVMGLAAVVVLASAYFRARGSSLVEIEHSKASAGCAVYAFGLGVPLLLLGGKGGIGWGLALVAVAFLAGLRRYVVVDRGGGTLTSGWQLFLLRVNGTPKPFGIVERIAIVPVPSTEPGERRWRVDACASEGVRHEMAINTDKAVYEGEAKKLAELLAVPWGYEVEEDEGEEDVDDEDEDLDVDEDEDGASLEEEGRDAWEAQPATATAASVAAGHREPEKWEPVGPSGVQVVGGGARSVLAAGGCLLLLLLIGVAVYLVRQGGG